MRRVAAALLVLTLAACTEAGPTSEASDRVQVVKTLMRALEKGDCDTVKDMVVTPSQIDCGQIDEAAGMLEAEGVELDEVKYKAGSITDDSSIVTISWGPDLPPEPIELQRVEGKWLVVFDSAA